MSICFDVYRMSDRGERELLHSTQSAREARELRDAGPGEMIVVGRETDIHPRGLKIVDDLEKVNGTIADDRADLTVLTTSPEEQQEIRHHIARCFHGLRELAIEVEDGKPANDAEGDFPI